MKWKIIISVIPILISLGALSASYLLYQESQKSNKIAEEALDYSETAFIFENRPYLTLSPHKFKDEDRYILASEIEGGVELKLKFEIKNNGRVAAKRIHTPECIKVTSKVDDPDKLLNISLDVPEETMDLAPNETIYIAFVIRMGEFNKQEIDENIRKVENNELPLPITMTVFYKSDLDPSVQYKTSVSATIQTFNVIISGSEMI